MFPDTLTHLILKVDEGDTNICFIERKSSLKEFEVCSKSPNQHRSGLSPKIAIFGFLSCLLCSPHYWDRERWIRGELSKDPGTPEQAADQHGIIGELERGTWASPKAPRERPSGVWGIQITRHVNLSKPHSGSKVLGTNKQTMLYLKSFTLMEGCESRKGRVPNSASEETSRVLKESLTGWLLVH